MSSADSAGSTGVSHAGSPSVFCPHCSRSVAPERVVTFGTGGDQVICQSCVMGAWELTSGAPAFYRLKDRVALDLPSRGTRVDESLEWMRVSLLPELRKFRRLLESAAREPGSRIWRELVDECAGDLRDLACRMHLNLSSNTGGQDG